jgi:hypothetical protein
MAIIKISAPGSTPSGISDWSAVVAQLAALVLDKENPIRISGTNVLKGSLFNIGGAMFIADADTAISGTASNYVKLTVSGSSATPSFVADLAGVSWNSASKGYYDASGNLYIFDELKTYVAGAISSFNKDNFNLKSLGSGWPLYLSKDKISASGLYFLAQGSRTMINSSLVAYEKCLEYKCQSDGVLHATMVMYRTSPGNCYGRIYINNDPYGPEHNGTGSISGPFVEDITVSPGDLIQVYTRQEAGTTGYILRLEDSISPGFANGYGAADL